MGEKLPEIDLKIQFIPFCSEKEGLDIEYIFETKGDFHVLEGQEPIFIEIKENSGGVFEEMLIKKGSFQEVLDFLFEFVID